MQLLLECYFAMLSAISVFMYRNYFRHMLSGASCKHVDVRHPAGCDLRVERPLYAILLIRMLNFPCMFCACHIRVSYDTMMLATSPKLIVMIRTGTTNTAKVGYRAPNATYDRRQY